MTGRGRVVRLCEAGGDARELRLRLLDELRTSIGFDAYTFLLTDPQTQVGCAPVADVPVRRELPRAIRLKYLTRANRWTGIEDVALLSDLPDRTVSPLWNDLLRHHGIRDIASTVFRDRHGTWGFLDLWRRDRDFTPREAAHLADLTAPITTALRRSQAATFVVRPSHEPRSEPLVLVLSPDMGVVGQTPRHPRLPARPGSSGARPRARIHLVDGLWLTLRAARRKGAVAVTVEESSPAERLSVFCRVHALGARETELLGLLAKGCDSHPGDLKSVLAKTGTHTRRDLLARALGA